MFEWLTNRIHRKPEEKAVKKRSFEGARGGRLYSDFFGSSTSANSELNGNIVVLRDKARELCRNNSYAVRYLSNLTNGVLGEKGFSFQCKATIDRPREGANVVLDQKGNQWVEDAFQKWSRKCTADGLYSIQDVYRLCLQSLARDGEILIKKVRSPEYKDGFALQLLEADYLDECFTDTYQGNRVQMGVEVNQYDKPLAYWIKSGGHPNDRTQRSTGRTRIPAEEIIHLHLPDRAQQVRSGSWFAPVMNKLHTLESYEKAELISAKISAQKLGFITTPDGEGFIGDEETDDGDQILHSEPGSIQQLAQGQEFTSWDPEHPVSAFADFHKAILRGIASGLNASFHSLSNNLESVNYSSLRQGLIDERDYYKRIQRFLIDHLALPIAQEWLKMWMSFNPRALPLIRYEKFSGALAMYGRGFTWVDPAKEIKAESEAVHLGIKTRQDIAMQQGRDIEDVFSQIQAEKQMAEKYGIILGDEPYGSVHMPINPVGFEDQSQD